MTAWTISRATIEAVDDAGTQQLVRARGLRAETFTEVHRVQPHGLSAVPPVGSEGTFLRLGASERVLALGFENKQHRPRGLNPGEVALYDASGQMVSLVQQKIRIVSATKVEIVAPEIVLDGLVKLGGADADKPAGMEGTLDSADQPLRSNFATRVLMK